VAQVRVVFRIPDKASRLLFRSGSSRPKLLAYVEWLSKFREHPNLHHGMYRIMRAFKEGKREASIIPILSIFRSVHLVPKFRSVVPEAWTSSNVLEECSILNILQIAQILYKSINIILGFRPTANMRKALPICKYFLRDGFPDEYLADHCTGMGGRRTYWKHLGRVGQFRLAQVATRYIRSVHDGVFESASMRTISPSF
jgi:hypothetical protein